MKPACALGILCLVGTPALAGPMALPFDVTDGQVQLTWLPAGAFNPTTNTSPMVGTFALTINGEDGHVGSSDTVTLDGMNLTNTEHMTTVFIGVATWSFLAGDLRFLDFDTTVPGHLDGGVATPTGSIYLEVTLSPGYEGGTTFSTTMWRPSPLTNVTFTPASSAVGSETLTANLQFSCAWEFGMSSIGATMTLDFVVSVTGTAHVPEPALGSLVVLGLGGAGAWLRRRR